MSDFLILWLRVSHHFLACSKGGVEEWDAAGVGGRKERRGEVLAPPKNRGQSSVSSVSHIVPQQLWRGEVVEFGVDKA